MAIEYLDLSVVGAGALLEACRVGLYAVGAMPLPLPSTSPPLYVAEQLVLGCLRWTRLLFRERQTIFLGLP